MVDRHSGCPIPDGQELKSEIQKDGSKTLYHVNLGTGIRVNSVEDMFCYKNSKSRENNPKQNYVNLGTGIRVNSVEDMFRYKDRESGENTPKQFSDWRPHQSRPSILQSVQGSWPQYLPLPLSATSGNSKTYCCWATRNTARSVALPNFLF